MNDQAATMQNCGTLTKTAACDNVYYPNPQSTPITAGSLASYSYVYPYADTRVTVLEAEVRVLKEMLAALLSGRPSVAPPRRRKGITGGGV